MNMRQHRRKQARRWDSVHNSLSAMDDFRMWPVRDIKPCPTYSPWCMQCNAGIFRSVMGRYPRNIFEFNDFEDKQQLNATQ